MRDYAKVRPQIWIRGTGRAVRGDREASQMMFYLISAPTMNMLGLYYLPLSTLAHELEYPSEEAAFAVLERLIATGFCRYDRESEYVWVVNGAREQIEEELKPRDNRIKGIRSELKKHRKAPFHDAFVERYDAAFCLEMLKDTSPAPRGGGTNSGPYEGAPKGLRRGSEGVPTPEECPSKPGAGAGAGLRTGSGDDARADAHESPPERVTVPEGLKPERADDEPEPPGWRDTRDLVRLRFSAAYDQARGGLPTWPAHNLRAARVIAGWLESLDGDPERILAVTLEHFFADEYMAAKAFPIELLAKECDKFWKPPKPLRPRHKGFAPPSKKFRPKTDAEFDAELDAVFGPPPEGAR